MAYLKTKRATYVAQGDDTADGGKPLWGLLAIIGIGGFAFFLQAKTAR